MENPASTAEHSSDELIGQLLAGNFRVLERMGAGGMGTVYRAYNEKLEQTVALKIVHPDLARDNNTLLRLQREAKALATLKHPNILAAHSLQMLDEHTCCLVMEYLPGTDLGQEIATNGPLSLPRTQRILAQCADALAYAHAEGIVHRDIKPSNIMLINENGTESVKIVDFGISKTLADAQQGLTKDGSLLGSPSYMSPEQIKGEEATPLSDIYSLGCVLYEALSGKPPFTGDNLVEIGYMHLNKAVPDLPKKELASISRVIQRATQKDPTRRYNTMKQFAKAIQHGESGSQKISSWPNPLAAGTRRGFGAPPAKFALIGLLIGVIVALVVMGSFVHSGTVPFNALTSQQQASPETEIDRLLRVATTKKQLNDDETLRLQQSLNALPPSHRSLPQLRAAGIYAILQRTPLVDEHVEQALKASTTGSENDHIRQVVDELRGLGERDAAATFMTHAADATASRVSHNDARFLWCEYIKLAEDDQKWNNVYEAILKLAALDGEGSHYFYDLSRMQTAQAQIMQRQAKDAIATIDDWLKQSPGQPKSNLLKAWAHSLKADAWLQLGQLSNVRSERARGKEFANLSISENKDIPDAQRIIQRCDRPIQ